MRKAEGKHCFQKLVLREKSMGPVLAQTKTLSFGGIGCIWFEVPQNNR
jgi:hypothetical protein